MKKSEVRGKVLAHQRELDLEPILLAHSRALTIAHLISCVERCVEWEARHGRQLTALDLSGDNELPEGYFLSRAFGSLPSFLAFLHDEEA